jgi:hypothetical protein
MQVYSSRLKRECELSGLMKFGGSQLKFCVIHELEDPTWG